MGDSDELMEIFRSPEYGQMMSQMPQSEQDHMSQQIDSFSDTADTTAYLRGAIAFKNENPNTSLTTVDSNFQPLAPAADPAAHSFQTIWSPNTSIICSSISLIKVLAETPLFSSSSRASWLTLGSAKQTPTSSLNNASTCPFS